MAERAFSVWWIAAFISILVAAAEQQRVEQLTVETPVQLSLGGRGQNIPSRPSRELSDVFLRLALRLVTCSTASVSTSCRSNTIVSPLSISSALAMLFVGSNGESREQLRAALALPAGDTATDVLKKFDSVLTHLKTPNDNVILDTANGMFSLLPFKREFREKVFFYLKGTASRLGFRDEAAAPDKNALNKWVNEWVSTKTHNKLRSALPPGSWNDWVLVNAVYLKADWMQPFSLDATQAAEFTVSAEEKLANVLFMGEQFEELPYTEDKELGVEMISLNYKGGELAMYIMLPKETDGLSSLTKLESQLTAEVINGLIDALEPRRVRVRLPKFRISKRTNLKNSMMGMGVVDLFDSTKADLSNMTPTEMTALEGVIHQGLIEVSEAGTEGAAITEVFGNRISAGNSFVANRPFLYFVMDRTTRTALFFGRVVRPIF